MMSKDAVYIGAKTMKKFILKINVKNARRILKDLKIISVILNVSKKKYMILQLNNVKIAQISGSAIQI